MSVNLWTYIQYSKFLKTILLQCQQALEEAQSHEQYPRQEPQILRSDGISPSLMHSSQYSCPFVYRNSERISNLVAALWVFFFLSTDELYISVWFFALFFVERM